MGSSIIRSAAAFAAAVVLCGAAGGTNAQMGTIRVDNWLFYQSNYGDTARWQYRARVFFPFPLRDGWTFTQRFDVPFYYTDAPGPGNAGGGWKGRFSDILVEEIFDTPEVAKNVRLRGSLRLVLPTGGESPFGADQWQVAPGFGGTWQLPDVWRGMTVAPYARYYYGFSAGSPDVTTKRSWSIIPEVSFPLSEKWSLSFYPEQGISYDVRSGKWFVPVEAMVTHRVSKSWDYALGGAYALVDDDKSYRWLLQARFRFFY